MALFNKDRETNSRPEYSHEPSRSLACLAFSHSPGRTLHRRTTHSSFARGRRRPAQRGRCARVRSIRVHRNKRQALLRGPVQIDGQIEGRDSRQGRSRDRSGCLGDGQDQGSLGHRGGNGQWRDHRHPTDRDSPFGQDIGQSRCAQNSHARGRGVRGSLRHETGRAARGPQADGSSARRTDGTAGCGSEVSPRRDSRNRRRGAG